MTDLVEVARVPGRRGRAPLPSRILAGLATVAMASLAVGCTAEIADLPVLTREQIRDLAGQAEASGWLDQAAALQDGEVDDDEYAAAYERFASCLGDLGYPEPTTWVSPIDGLTLLIEVDDAGRTPEAKDRDVAACQDEHFGMVSAVYQDTAPYDMDPRIRTAAIACLEDAGYDLDGDESTPLELAGPGALGTDAGPSERWNATVECLGDAQRELFPELPYVTITGR